MGVLSNILKAIFYLPKGDYTLNEHESHIVSIRGILKEVQKAAGPFLGLHVCLCELGLPTALT